MSISTKDQNSAYNISQSEDIKPTKRGPKVEIEYCKQCKWMMRAAWMAQELLSTLGDHIGEMSLIPGGTATFIIRVDGVTVFDRKLEKRFPEMKEAKQLVRNLVAPELGLGHSDKPVVKRETEKDEIQTDGPVCADCQ